MTADSTDVIRDDADRCKRGMLGFLSAHRVGCDKPSYMTHVTEAEAEFHVRRYGELGIVFVSAPFWTASVDGRRPGVDAGSRL